MKNTCRNLLFFKAIFNGRIDDQGIASHFAGSTPSDVTSKGADKHAAKGAMQTPAYPSVLGADSAFVFPYGTACAGTIAAGDAAVTVEGSFKKLLVPSVAAASSSSSAAPAKLSKLSFFSNGALYEVPATFTGAANNTATFATATAATKVASSSSSSIEMEGVVKASNVYIAQLASAAMFDLAVTAARHTTSIVEFDQYLAHNQTVQRQMAIIETSRYALDALAVGAEEEDSPFVAVFARLALANAIKASDAIFGALALQFPEVTTRPHPSNKKGLAIDYTSLAKARALLAELEVTGGATDADVGRYAMGELFGKDSTKVKPAGIFNKRPLHMSPTHGNALGFATAAEIELAAFPSEVLKQVSAKNSLQVKVATEIAAELLATVAVLHRFSAALTNDVDGEGRVQASIAPVFCSLSAARRAEALRTLQALKGAAKTKPQSLDDASVHPSQF